MSLNRVPVEVRRLAESVLTDAQFDAWTLELAGLGQRRIARALGISRSAVCSRLDHVHRKLADLGVSQDEHGRWLVRRAA